MAGGSIAAFSIALAAMNEDDERYKKLTKDQKSMYWWIYLDKFVPKKTLEAMGVNPVLKMPKPYDVGVIFASVPESMFEYISGNTDSEELKARLMFDMYRSGAIMDFPSVFKGALEVGFNKDWRGVPIESLGMQFQPKEMRAKHYTPEVYKKLGNQYLSPVQIHHLSNSFLGLYGRMIDDAMNTATWDEDEKGEKAFSDYNPLSYLTSRMRGREVQRRTKWDEKFYDIYQQAQQAHGEVRVYKDQKDKGALDEFRKDKERMTLYRIKDHADNVQKKLSNISNAIQNVRDGKTKAKTQEAKEKEINRLYRLKHSMLEEVVTDYESILK